MSLAVPTLLALEQLSSLKLVKLVEVNLDTLRAALLSLENNWKNQRDVFFTMTTMREKFKAWDCKSVGKLRKRIQRDEFFARSGETHKEEKAIQRFLDAYNLALRDSRQDPADLFDTTFVIDLMRSMTTIDQRIIEKQKHCATVYKEFVILRKIVKMNEQKVTRAKFYSEMTALGIKLPPVD